MKHDGHITNEDLPDGVTFDDLPEEIRGGAVNECPVCDFTSVQIMNHIAQIHPKVHAVYRQTRVRVYEYVGDDETPRRS